MLSTTKPKQRGAKKSIRSIALVKIDLPDDPNHRPVYFIQTDDTYKYKVIEIPSGFVVCDQASNTFELSIMLTGNSNYITWLIVLVVANKSIQTIKHNSPPDETLKVINISINQLLQDEKL